MNSILKTILFISLFIFVNQSLFAQDNGKIVTITISGSGKTQDEAKQSALRSAIEQVFGAFISNKTEILNDQLVSDQITSIANGNIQSFSIMNEAQFPDGSWGVTLKVIVSVSKLTSFVQAKGIAVEIKGGLFALNVKQQLLDEQGEMIAVYNLVSSLHGPMQIAFDYKIESNEPKSIDAMSSNWEIPLRVYATANKNMDFCAQYFINTLNALSLSSEEIATYKSLNKDIFPLIINYRGEFGKFYLRKIESVKVLKFLIDNWVFYTSQFKVVSGLDEISVTKLFNELEKKYKSVSKRDGKFYKNYFFTKEKYFHESNIHLENCKLNIFIFNESIGINNEYTGENSIDFNFLTAGQKVATFDWNDKRSLSEIEQMTGYEVKNSGGSSQIKYGGLVVSNENGNILVTTIMDLVDLNWAEAKERCDELVIGGYDDWRLPTIEELNNISINIKEEGIGGFSFRDYSYYKYWSSSEISDRAFLVEYVYNTKKLEYKTEDRAAVRPVRVFNLYNKSVSKSVINESISVDKKTDNNLTSASAVYNKYIEAIGGVKTIENINTVKMVSEHAGPGYKLISTEIKKPNKYKFIYQVPQKKPALTMVINGNNSYLLENSKKTKMDANDILEYFEETDPQYQIHQEIFGINRVFKQRKDNNHILSYSLGKNKEIEEYYDVNTGFLVKKIQTVVGKNGTSKNVEITEFEDYKEIPGFTGYKVPYIKRVKTNNEDVEVQKLVLIEINKDVSDNEFE